MQARYLACILLSLISFSTTLAHPYRGVHERTLKTIGSGLLPPTTINIPASLDLVNASAASPVNAQVTCFHDGLTTNVTGCRPTLNYIRTFPDYKKVQPFLEHKSPKVPNKPPMIIFHRESTCAIEISAQNPQYEDRFSFEQVRALATDIVEECQVEGGYGGYAFIGKKKWWAIKVIGFVKSTAAVDVD